MEYKQAQFIPKGMSKDLSISKFNPEFSYDNKNIRITSREDTSLLSIQNEKGTTLIPLTEIKGKCIGYATINEYLVIFTTQTSPKLDRIYRIANLSTVVLLAEMDMKFSPNHPLTTSTLYETATVQKVYFVDGINQPRVINITSPSQPTFPQGYDFAPVLQYNHSVTITKNLLGGLFPSGTIQYACTYFNKFGAETGVFYLSSLYYLSGTDRALAPDELATNSFKLTLSSLDTNYDYVRIYSIQKSSFNSTPLVKVIGDYEINTPSIKAIDTGSIGYEVDPYILLYIGSEELVLKDFAIKDNTFFGANITLLRISNLDTLNLSGLSNNITWAYKNSIPIEQLSQANNVAYTYKPYTLNLPKKLSSHFKRGQYYRFGIQAQHKTGKWSEPFYLGADIECPLSYLTKYDEESQQVELLLNKAELTLSAANVNSLLAAGYTKVRPVMVYPELQDRIVIAQGVATNTIAFNHLRGQNSPFAMTDYIFRPTWRNKNPLHYLYPSYPSEWIPVPYPLASNGHLLVASGDLEAGIFATSGYVDEAIAVDNTSPNPYQLFMDENMLNIYSPDIEYNPNIKALLTEDIYCQIVGLANLTSSATSFEYDYEGGTKQYYNKINLNNYNPLSREYTYLSAGHQHEDYLFKPSPIYPGVYAGDTKSEILYNKNSIKLYSAFNTIFQDHEILKYDIFKGLYTDREDSSTVVPYNSNPMDFYGGTLISNIIDETLIHNYTATPGKPTSTRLGYKGNSNITIALKDTGNQLKISTAFPSFIDSGGFSTSTQFNDETPPDPTGKAIVNIYPGLREDCEFTIQDNKYYASFNLLVTIENIENMADGDSIIITPTLKRKVYSLNAPFYLLEDATLSSITLTKATYLSLPDYALAPNTKILHISDALLGSAVINQAHAVLDYYPEIPILSSASTNLILNYNHEVFKVGQGIPITEFYYPITPYYRESNPSFYGYSKRFINLNYFKVNHSYNSYQRNLMYLPLVELKRTVTADLLNSLYGGKTIDALLNNLWIPAGEGVNLTYGTTAKIEYEEGDTFVQRHDLLKTVPSNEDEINKVVSVFSYLCESYINLDGKYDRNRYNINTSTMRFTNFGLLNTAYNQANNFFNFRILDSRLFENNSFNNQIVWSKPKNNGELLDSWTNLNLASTASLEGNLGSINALINHNDTLYTFQNKGIAQIIFNPRIQIPTSDNVPIEITNSGKLEGYRYISNHLGALHKYNILSGKQGLYFIDPLNKSFHRLGESIENLTESLGFREWAYNNLTEDTKLFTDSIFNDIYLKNSSYCLNYSESLGTFISFYDYFTADFLPVFNSNWLSIKTQDNTTYVYSNNTGLYNTFFEESKDSYIHYKMAPESHLDKTFTNFEYRADIYENTELLNNRTFDTLQVWNEYQDSGVTTLTPRSNIFKKFRVWQGFIPRNKTNRDRIRNTWINFKLTLKPKSGENLKLILHDLIIKYII